MKFTHKSKRLKVILVTNMVAPYRVGFYNSLAEHCNLVVVVDTESEFNRSWKLDENNFRFTRIIMNSFSFVMPRIRKDLGCREHRQMHLSQRLFLQIWRENPDIVISNELGLRSLWCLLYSKFSGVPWILVSEATNHTEGWVGLIKRIYRRFLIAQADGFWSNGKETSQFLMDRGADKDFIYQDMTGISTNDFKEAASIALLGRDALRASMGLSGTVFMFAGRLESGKGLAYLMDAIRQRESDLVGKCSFLLVGDGSMKEELKQQADKIVGIPFHFQGFVQPEELPDYFAAGDVFIMPTLDDNWPLVNLEALAAGIPQIYSIFNGGALDLNEVAGIGDSIDPTSIGTLGQKLVDCVKNPPRRITSESAMICLEHYSPESQAQRAMESILRSLDFAIGH